MDNIYKDLKIASIIVLAICVVTILINYFILNEFSFGLIVEQAFYNAYYGFPITFGISWFFDFLNEKISWDNNPKKRAVFGVVGTVVMTMLLLITLNFFLWVVIEGRPINSLYIKSNRLFYLIGLIITVIVTSIMHAVGFFNEVQIEKEKSHKLTQQKLSSELNALRAHVDPHFLFNSFNVLSGLIDEDKERAQSFLSGLSSIYRYVLEQRNETTATLREELRFADRYLELQRMRFEDAIMLTKDIKEEFLDFKIPSLSLQLLLENTIKHNAFDANDPLLISLEVKGDYLVVKNNVKTKNDFISSNGVGLQNIKDRYQLLAQKNIQVENNNKQFIIKLPLL